ncbi:MAG: transposase DNA-binding-containing protein, partial [Bacteroidales bacterium]
MGISNLSLFDKNAFGDSRLANRGNYIINALINTGTSVINRMFVGWDSKMAAFRFLANP